MDLKAQKSAQDDADKELGDNIGLPWVDRAMRFAWRPGESRKRKPVQRDEHGGR